MTSGAKDWYRAEPVKTKLQLLREKKGFIGTGSLPGQVGDYTWITLYNPINSGVEVYLERVILQAGKDCLILTRRDLGYGTYNSTFKKNRYLGEAAPAAIIGGGYDFVGGTYDYGFFRLSAFTERTLDPVDIWIPPHAGFSFVTNTADTLFTVIPWWYEITDY
jgi:hypothetical protein